MAPFRWPDDANRLDFELLRESPVSLYFSREVLAEHVAWLREQRYTVHAFDCSGWASEDDFHRVVGPALGFPKYGGRNMAAFKDTLCLADIPKDGGLVLAFSSFHRFHERFPEPAWHALDIIAHWSRFFLLTGQRLLAMVHSDDRDIQIRPVGARPVLWNATERRKVVQEKREAAR